MTAHLTRGLGGRREIHILILTLVLGIVAVGLVLAFRQQVHAPPPPPPVGLSEAELLARGRNARGPEIERAYAPGDRARIAVPAIGRNSQGQWVPLPAERVFKVETVEVDGRVTWVHGRFESGENTEPFTVHPSFLDPYRPVILDDVLELSAVRLVTTVVEGQRTVGLRGRLCNISDAPLEALTVACSFLNADGDELDVKRASFADLPPGQLTEFQTIGTDRAFASVTIQPSILDPQHRPRYLSSVSISRAVE